MLSKALMMMMSLNDLPAPLSLFNHIWCRFFADPLGGMSRAHEAGGVAPFLIPVESRSVAAADVFVDGEIEARK
jgi:hypothetical protein